MVEQKVNVGKVYNYALPIVKTFLVTVPKTTKINTIDDILNLIPNSNKKINSLVYTYHGLQFNETQTKPLINVMKDGQSLPLAQYGDITGYLTRGQSQLVTGYVIENGKIKADTRVLAVDDNFTKPSDDLQIIVQIS